MPLLIDDAKVRGECNLPSLSIDLTSHIRHAERVVRRMLTVDTAGDRFDAIANEDAPYDADDLADLEQAVALYAGSYALDFLGHESSDKGVKRTFGKGTTLDEKDHLLSSKEIEAKQGAWRAQAQEILTQFVPSVTEADSDEDEVLTIGGLTIGALNPSNTENPVDPRTC